MKYETNPKYKAQNPKQKQAALHHCLVICILFIGIC
jgi:hypothetical protein